MTGRTALVVSLLTLNACGEDSSSPEERTLGSLDASIRDTRDATVVDLTPDELVVDTAVSVDLPLPAETQAPDINISVGPATIGVGKPCQDDMACGLGLFCLDEGEGWPGEGYCTKPGCTEDGECGLDSL